MIWLESTGSAAALGSKSVESTVRSGLVRPTVKTTRKSAIAAGTSPSDVLPGVARRTAEPIERDDPLAQPERVGESVRRALAEAAHLAGAPRLDVDRRHAHAVDPARHDPLERLEVTVHVHGQAVHGHAAGHVHADRADLALAHPDPREPLPHGRVDTLLGQRRDHRSL